MEFYNFAAAGDLGLPRFNSSVFLNLLTEAELLALFRDDTQIIADTALLMSKRDSYVDVLSARFDAVMAACVTAEIFDSARVAEFKRGIIPSPFQR
tara:strand:- start:466 stop:753 length:288 start_codon:yes stop_codon:yes gene_type:complete